MGLTQSKKFMKQFKSLALTFLIGMFLCVGVTTDAAPTKDVVTITADVGIDAPVFDCMESEVLVPVQIDQEFAFSPVIVSEYCEAILTNYESPGGEELSYSEQYSSQNYSHSNKILKHANCRIGYTMRC